ncbi:MAG: hypothetical protein HRU41_26645 [Saprospiraceae bacterium]|nr:hypothetical protein [Saprospiraceae bacterium]
MSGQNRMLVGILVVIWTAFGFWQTANRDLLQDAPEGTIRLDLWMVLPVLVAITVALVVVIAKDRKKKQTKGISYPGQEN